MATPIESLLVSIRVTGATDDTSLPCLLKLCSGMQNRYTTS
jgi:hypothetical protein